jgi:hypothetical protein
MRELDANLLALAVDVVDDTLQRRDLAVFPEARVVGGNAAAGFDGGGFYDDEAGAVEGELAEVDEVPVG